MQVNLIRATTVRSHSTVSPVCKFRTGWKPVLLTPVSLLTVPVKETL
jgi:hypothetical protein